MLRPARPGGQNAPDPLLDELRLAISRIADEALGLDCALDGIATRNVDRAAVEIAEHAMIFQVLGVGLPGGLMLVGPELLHALIEVQVTGRVSCTSRPARPPTRTDAVVVSPLLDLWLAALAEGEAAHPAFRGVRRGALMADAKAATLTLDNVEFAGLRLSLTLGGAQNAELEFILPHRSGDMGESGEDIDFRDLPVMLDVVLGRVSRRLGEARRLAPGSFLDLGADALSEAALEHGGRRLARVRLGRVGSQRAVRSDVAPPPPPFPIEGDAGTGSMAGPDMMRGVPVSDAAESLASGALPSSEAAGRMEDTSEAEAQPSGTEGSAPEEDTGDFAELPAPGDLPPLADLPEMATLPDIDDLPPLP